MLADCSSTSRVIKLTLTLPPPQTNPDYFYNLLLQYGKVCKVKVLVKALSEVQVLIQMDSLASAMKVKTAMDALGSPFIICDFTNQSTFTIYPSDDAKEYFPVSPIYSNLHSSTSLIPDTPQQFDLSNISDSLSNINSKSDLNDSLQTIQQQNNNNNPSVQSLPPSSVICITNINNQQCNAQKIYNVFSNFGNINQILLIKFQNFALVQFENEENAIFVHENCQNLMFMDSEISITYAIDDAIEKLKHLTALYHPNDLFIATDQTHRFNNLKKVPLLPPTRILHVSNLKPACSNYEMMWDLFSDFGVVEAVKVLNSQSKFMCLVKMESLDQAIKSMAFMHNYDLEGRNIQISFTKSRI